MTEQHTAPSRGGMSLTHDNNSKNNNDNNTYDISSSSSKTRQVLVSSRRELWNMHLPFVIDSVREFVMDPSLKFWTIVLPPFATYIKADGIVSTTISITCLTPMLGIMNFFALPPNLTSRGEDDEEQQDQKRDMMTEHAKKSILRSTLGTTPRFKPPSEYASSMRGIFAFTFSAAADLVGALLNPQKMKQWFDALANFHAYLHVSGVGADLEESMMKPLRMGRLLDNMKMLNDIQALEDHQRAELVRIKKNDSNDDTIITINNDNDNMDMELTKASVMMRFATAAYGVEIIKSAMDRDVDVMELLEDECKAIAFHTCLASADDVKFLKGGDGGDMATLCHYVAVDANHKAVVLSLRGTLSISGALVDMQAMDRAYCGGRAHQGISEMADAVWNESGTFISNLLKEEQYKGYDFIITGHSLGAGTATLLHLKIHVEDLLPHHRVFCFGFAPPPAFWCDNTATTNPTTRNAIERAMQTCICYIHDNDCVPHLSVAAIRRLSTLMDTVDKYNERVWFWKRSLIFWGWRALPTELIEDVMAAQKQLFETNVQRENGAGDCEMMIPARLVVWMKKDKKTGLFDAIPCRPDRVTKLNIYMCQDMITDHMPEQYENALDAVLQSSLLPPFPTTTRTTAEIIDSMV